MWNKLKNQQKASGKFWQNLFKTDFDNHFFVDVSDTTQIGKEAYTEGCHNILSLIKDKLDKTSIEKIESHIKDHIEKDYTE